MNAREQAPTHCMLFHHTQLLTEAEQHSVAHQAEQRQAAAQPDGAALPVGHPPHGLHQLMHRACSGATPQATTEALQLQLLLLLLKPGPSTAPSPLHADVEHKRQRVHSCNTRALARLLSLHAQPRTACGCCAARVLRARVSLLCCVVLCACVCVRVCVTVWLWQLWRHRRRLTCVWGGWPG